MTSVPNLSRNDDQYTFRVQGANPRGGCAIAILSLAYGTLIIIFGYGLLSLGGWWPWLSIPLSFLLLFAGMKALLWTKSHGTFAPWEIKIDPANSALSCFTQRGKKLWSIEMDPAKLYIAPMKLRAGDARKPPWVLAYSQEPAAPAEVADPSEEHIVLCEGEKDTLYAIADEVLNHPGWPRTTASAGVSSDDAEREDAADTTSGGV